MLACRISEYVKYIEGLEAIEEDDKACVDNRLLLEKAWQIIANEFYDAKGRFSQATWAGQLPDTLKVGDIERSHLPREQQKLRRSGA